MTRQVDKRVLGVCTAAMAVMIAATLALRGTDHEGLHAAIRNTARSSAFFFALFFLASPLDRLWPSRFMRAWAAAADAFLVALAVSHTAHGVFIILAHAWDLPSLVALVIYAAIYALAFYALAGRSGGWIESVSIYAVWFAFTVALGGRALSSPIYAAATAILVAGLLLRIVAGLRTAPAAA